MARSRQWHVRKRGHSSQRHGMASGFCPKKVRPAPRALGLRFMTQQLRIPRNKTSPVTYSHPAALAINFSTSTAEGPAALWIRGWALHPPSRASHTAWVLSKHICLVLCPPCPKSMLQVLAFFLPFSQQTISQLPPQSSATEKIQPPTPESCTLPCPPTPRRHPLISRTPCLRGKIIILS